MGDEVIERLLASIDRRLALLTLSEESNLRRALASFLGTSARIAMFEAIDGVRGSSDLAEEAKVSERSAQLFVKELLSIGLVHPAGDVGGRTVIVERDEEAILRWYVESLDL